jgi:hypothetical protein
MAVATLALSVVCASLPATARAEGTVPAFAQPRLDLRQVTRGITLENKAVRPQTTPRSFFSTPGGKTALALGVIVAAITVGYAASRGPDPTPADAK